MHSVWTSLSSLLALATLAYADCSTVAPGASDSFSGTFQLAAVGSTGTTSPLYLINSLTVPETGYHVLSVCTS